MSDGGVLVTTEMAVTLAGSAGVCVRPLLRRVTDRATGQVTSIPIACGSTRESKCLACAGKARRLRMHQCREGWHRSDDPVSQLDDADSITQDEGDEDQAAVDVDGPDDAAGTGERRARSTRRRDDAPDLPREVATRVFDRKGDAVSWEQDQSRRLRTGEWFDPRRGNVCLELVAAEWLASRSTVKRRTRESDAGAWRNYVAPRFARWPVSSITSAEVMSRVGGLVATGKAPATAARALATLRSILGYAVADGRIHVNVAAAVNAPRSGLSRREGQALTYEELHRLAALCSGNGSDVVLVLGLAGLRWREIAGLQVGDLVSVPGRGFRLQRAVLASGGGGELDVDSLKGRRARTVPLVADLHDVVARWSSGKAAGDWLFPAPGGGPMRESNWKRTVHWSASIAELGFPTLRVHDLRHTAASIWLGQGADPKVVQAVLGHATAAMTMDLYGHLVASNLWDAAQRIGGTTGARTASVTGIRPETTPPQVSDGVRDLG